MSDTTNKTTLNTNDNQLNQLPEPINGDIQLNHDHQPQRLVSELTEHP